MGNLGPRLRGLGQVVYRHVFLWAARDVAVPPGAITPEVFVELFTRLAIRFRRRHGLPNRPKLLVHDALHELIGAPPTLLGEMCVELLERSFHAPWRFPALSRHLGRLVVDAILTEGGAADVAAGPDAGTHPPNGSTPR